MAKEEKADTPPAGDDEASVFHPPNPLAAKVRKTKGTLNDLLANAETMLATMKDDFDVQIDQAVAELATIYSQWRGEATRAEAIVRFNGAANNLKGQSGSFGFALLGEIADLFRDYLTDIPAARQKPEAVLNYINSLQVVWKQKLSGDGGPVGRQIVADLTRLNAKEIEDSKS